MTAIRKDGVQFHAEHFSPSHPSQEDEKFAIEWFEEMKAALGNTFHSFQLIKITEITKRDKLL